MKAAKLLKVQSKVIVNSRHLTRLLERESGLQQQMIEMLKQRVLEACDPSTTQARRDEIAEAARGVTAGPAFVDGATGAEET